MSKKKMLFVSIIVVVIILSIVFLLVGNKEVSTYVVTFKTDGGSSVKTQNVKKGQRVIKPENPMKKDYEFIEWTYKNVTYDFNQSVKSNLTLVAKWSHLKKGENNFTIYFETDGGTTISNQVIKEGNKIVKPNDPVKKGYIFEGWTLNGEIFSFDTIVENDIKLKAKWKKLPANTISNIIKNINDTKSRNDLTLVSDVKKFTVIFDSNGGSAVNSQIVINGNKINKPSNPIRDGYSFGGWLLNGNIYDFNSKIDGDITLVAKWNKVSYVVKVSLVDQYSPDRILSVYQNDSEIEVSQIKYNGVILCKNDNMVVNKYEIGDVNSVVVVLTDGSSVVASIK